MLRTVSLSLHVVGGVSGLLLGVFALRPPDVDGVRHWLRRGYAAAIALLSTFLVALVALDWSSLASTQRITFAVLIGLAVVIVTRVALAFRVAQQRPNGWQTRYVNHIYFTYISLWEGFFIVGLLDLAAPVWVVGAVAVGVLVLGGILVNNYKQRWLRRPVTS